MTKQAIGYIRVSTEKQVKEGESLEAQEHKIKSWCEYHEYSLLHTFRDEGISGASMKKRDGLEAALKFIGKDMALVTYSLSRLTRSTRDLLKIADDLQEKGADLVSLSEKVDTTSAAGKMMFRMFGVIAEFEKDVIGERTCIGMQSKKLKGQYWGGLPPYGYSLGDGPPKKRLLVLNPREQEVTRFILKLHEQGYNLSQIAQLLTEHGIKTRAEKPFHAMQVSRILKRTWSL